MIICYVFLPQLISLESSNELRLNRKIILQVCLLQVQYFSQLEHVNPRPAKLESQFYQLPSSSYVIYKIDLQLYFKKHCRNRYGFQTTELQSGALGTEICILTQQNFEVSKQNFIATLELFLTMLGTELAYGP